MPYGGSTPEQDTKIESCVSGISGTNKRTGEPYTKSEKIAICKSQVMGKENKFCGFGKIQIKEDEKDYHVSGYVATSHPDRAESEGFAGDIIPKNTLQKITEQINNRYKPQAGAVSESHDWLKQGDASLPIAGVTTGQASLQQLTDGEWGVFVDTVLSKTNPRYEEVKTNIEQGVYPGFSIEYMTKNFIPTQKEGKNYRMLTDIDTEGFGFANRRIIANPHAEITSFGYKEIMPLIEKEESYHCSECNKNIPMSEKENHIKKHKGENKMDEKKEIKENVTEVVKDEVEERKIEFSEENIALLNKFKEE